MDNVVLLWYALRLAVAASICILQSRGICVFCLFVTEGKDI